MVDVMRIVPERAPEPGTPLAEEIAVFETARPGLAEAGHVGRHALVGAGRVVDAFDTVNDAIQTGYKEFGLAPFLVREVTAPDMPDIPAINVLPFEIVKD